MNDNLTFNLVFFSSIILGMAISFLFIEPTINNNGSMSLNLRPWVIKKLDSDKKINNQHDGMEKPQINLPNNSKEFIETAYLKQKEELNSKEFSQSQPSESKNIKDLINRKKLIIKNQNELSERIKIKNITLEEKIKILEEYKNLKLQANQLIEDLKITLKNKKP